MKVLKLFLLKVKVPKSVDLKAIVKESGCMKVKVLKVEDDVLLMLLYVQFLVPRISDWTTSSSTGLAIPRPLRTSSTHWQTPSANRISLVARFC